MTRAPRLGLVSLATLATLAGAVVPAAAADWPSGFSKGASEGGTCKVGSTPAPAPATDASREVACGGCGAS